MFDKQAVLAKEGDIDLQDRPKSGWLWCLHCERVYEYGWYRAVDGLQMCPYSGCDGSTFLDGGDWAEIRGHHPDYPGVPEYNRVYPLY